MKKGHIIELIIDCIILLIGLALSMLIYKEASILTCSIAMLATSLFELIEFLFNKDKKDSIFMSISLLICVLLILILKSKPNFVLAISFLSFTVLSLVVKVYSLKYIKKEMTRLFSLRYIIIGLFTILGVIISISTYYELLSKIYLFSLLITTFGLQELFCDILIHIDEIKEVFKR